MKVILLKDVAKIGKRGSIVEVPDGYAHNKLLPHKMAKPATKENVRVIEHDAQVQEQGKEKSLSDFREMIAFLEMNPVTITRPASKEGHLFEAVKLEAIADAVTSLTGKTLTAKQIKASAPLKSVGVHTLTLTHYDLKADCVVHIKSQT